jgi:carbon-monoxide dehydrogenase large subunit
MGVFTNTNPTSPSRAGRPEAVYAIERVNDVAARERMDRTVALRARILIPPRPCVRTGLVFTLPAAMGEELGRRASELRLVRVRGAPPATGAARDAAGMGVRARQQRRGGRTRTPYDEGAR